MMEFTGKLVSVDRDWQTGRFKLTFEANENVSGQIDGIKDCEKLSIKAGKYRKKRSLDANATLWLCIGRIAEALRADKWDIYLQMLKRYGKFTHICVKENAVEAVKRQWRETEEVGRLTINGQTAVQLLCFFGSSTYNAAEFTVLLDGVISEMKEMGLETPTSEEMRRAIDQWESQYCKANENASSAEQR